MTEPSAAAHAALMNATYRHQRRVYDVTRRYFLFGRDHLIDRLDPAPGATVLEVACGTGRNLALIDRRYPGRRLFGLDISSEMLRSAQARLGARARLAEADATAFDAGTLFGVARLDRILLSYSLSMIPGWRTALACAAGQVAAGGELHVVDFGDQAGLPRGFGPAFAAWLARFHVHPRADLREALEREAAATGGTARWQPLYRGYAQYGVLSAPA